MLAQPDPTPTPISTPISVEAISTHFQPQSVDGGDLAFAGVALAAGFLLGAISRAATRRLLTRIRGLPDDLATVISRIVGYVFIVLGLVTALSAVGLEFGPVLTILLMVALVAILVGRPLLSDLGAGVVLQSRRPLAVGEVMQSEGYEGIVTDIDGRVVTLRTWDGWEVRVRNSDILTNPIVKVADAGQVRVEFDIGVEYGTDLDAAVDIVTNVLSTTAGVRSVPAPTTIVHEFGESTIVLRCWIWAPPDRRWFVKDVAMRDVKRALDAQGIVIAFPQRVLHTATTDRSPLQS